MPKYGVKCKIKCNSMRTRRGGQRVRYNRQDDWHANWVELERHNMDCGPNVFSILGYADRETCNLLADRTVNGISGDTIVKILNEAYEGEHTWHHIEKDIETGSLLEQIKNYLDSKEATIASVGGDGHGHYFVVYRNKKTLIAIDAQSRWAGPLNDYLVQMETEMDGDTFYIMSSTNVLHDYNQVTKEMVDRYFPTSDEDQWGEDAQWGDGDQWGEDAQQEFGQTSGFGGQKFQSIGKRRKTLTKKRKRNFI
jgi:hypothetical protein